MKLRGMVWLMLVAQLFVAQQAQAQQAVVRSYENPALEIGQSYLTHYGPRCLAVLPTHVVEEAGDVAALLREGTAPLLGETTAFEDLGDDLSVADVAGAITTDCGYSTLSVSRAVASRIRANALASIRSVNSDGSIAQLSVTIIDDDGESFLRVQPTNEMNQLRKGQSGSLLVSGDTPIGMLLSVDARFGVGKVLRLDSMFAKIDRFASSADVPATTSSAMPPTAGPALRSSDANGAIVSWSALPVDAQHRAGNLLAMDDSPPWIAEVDQWPVEIEMQLPGERMAIAAIVLDARNVADMGELPATVELMISSTQSGRRWRSVSGGAIQFVDGTAAIPIAPSWARHVRLVIESAANNGNRISLGRLRVIPAD